MSTDRTLILCIDRDDDIGYKGNIESPVVGRVACLNAATKLGLADPEDSDTNAIFQAIKTYDERLEMGEDVLITVLAGNHMHMIEGDRKISADLSRVVKNNTITKCILVTDGAEDEFILPIIQSIVPVSSIQRVIIKQMPNLEGTYYIIKKIFDDPKIARQVFVPAGIAMLLYAIAYLIGYPDIAIIIVMGVIGIYLLFKGYGIDEYFSLFFNGLRSSFRGGRFSFLAYSIAILLAVLGFIMGLSSLLKWYPEDAGIFFLLLSFVYGSVTWFTASGLTALAGKLTDVYLNERQNLGKLSVMPFFIASIGIFGWGASVYVLSLSGNIDFPFNMDDGVRIIIFSIIGGLLCSFTGLYVQKHLKKWAELKLSNDKKDEL